MSNIKIGFARCDITPPSGVRLQGYYQKYFAKGMLDPLEANVVAFSDGEKTAVAVSVDLTGLPQVWSDKLRGVISGLTSLPIEAVYVCCTHTHTAPTITGAYQPRDDAYISIMFRRIADAAKSAIDDMVEGTFFIARGEVKNLSFVRRYKMKNGKTVTNPGFFNPEIDYPVSTPDESLQLVRITREGKEDVVILNYQTHPDVIGGFKYSADWPGHTRRAFEGGVPNTKCIFFNGAEGDTNHICFTGEYDTPIDYTYSCHMGRCVAGEAMKLYSYAEPIEGEGVDFVNYPIEVKSNRGTPEELPHAEKIIALHEAGLDDEIPGIGMDKTANIDEAYRIKKLENGPDYFTLNLSAVKVGGIAFAGVPGEPFTDIGREIKERSPFDMTLVCCLANGAEGYYPMLSAFEEGGYEANSSEFAPGVGERIIDGELEILHRLHR